MHLGPSEVLGLTRSRATIASVLQARAQHQPASLAYRFLLDGDSLETCIGYGELDRRARAIAALLLARGAPGQRALLVYPAGIDFIAAWFGCAYASIVPVVVPPPHPARVPQFVERVAGIAHDAGPAFALTTSVLHEAVQSSTLPPALRSACWLATDGDLDEPLVELPDASSGDNVAFLQYTSGSTNEPRGVMVTHDNLSHNLRAILAAFARPGDKGSVCWLPPYHDMGLIGGLLGPVVMGAPVTLMAPAAFVQRPRRWLAAISRYGAAISGGPNFAYDLCVRKVLPEQFDGLDLSGWRCAFNGAEPIDPATLDSFARHFTPCGFDRRALTPCYGLAEATLLVAVKPYFAHPKLRIVGRSELVSCGPPIENVAIVDADTGRRCPSGCVGEIWVSGPSVAAGYRNCPGDNSRTFDARPVGETGSYLRTGDLGVLLDDELYVTGRLKDVIIIDGTNHYPQDIERSVARCHPALESGDCAALAVNVHSAEALVIVAGVRHAPGNDAPGILRAVRTVVSEAHGLAIHNVTLVHAGSIPRTPSGKVRRHVCRDAWLARSLATWEST